MLKRLATALYVAELSRFAVARHADAAYRRVNDKQSTHHLMEELMRNRWVAPLSTFAIAVLAGSLLEIRALA
ncbi:MAG: hypothetical protein ABWY66_07670 [Xanthobacteraceae bacterium]